jgi:hypothetical protein
VAAADHVEAVAETVTNAAPPGTLAISAHVAAPQPAAANAWTPAPPGRYTTPPATTGWLTAAAAGCAVAPVQIGGQVAAPQPPTGACQAIVPVAALSAMRSRASTR